MPLLGAMVLFTVFALNVVLGSISGNAFLSDVGEMLTLLAATVLFVVAILRIEAAGKQKAAKQSPQGGQDIE